VADSDESEAPAEVPGPDERAEARIKQVAEEDSWPGDDEGGRRKSRLRRTLSRWANSTDQHARELRQAVRDSGLVTISDAPDRTRVQLSGTLRTVTLRPRGGVPALEAELFDGSGALTLVWLGRRQITGISPGRQLEVEGRIGVQDGVRVMYNPRYELRA
jgi:ferric-dicitrate binding protein FerR (iron transport regulator)